MNTWVWSMGGNNNNMWIGYRYVVKSYEPTGQMPSLKAANAENGFRFVQLAFGKSHSVMPN